MHFITAVTIGFLFLEIANVATLYFFPGAKYANGVGVFKAWNKSKAEPEIHDFVKYLINWVAGTKLIFIALLIVILLVANERTLIISGIALVISITFFFWRLFPLIRTMDREGQIEPQNYSVVLGWMIGGIILIFSAAIIYSFIG